MKHASKQLSSYIFLLMTQPCNLASSQASIDVNLIFFNINRNQKYSKGRFFQDRKQKKRNKKEEKAEGKDFEEKKMKYREETTQLYRRNKIF